MAGSFDCVFGGGVLLAATGFPTVKYLRILSKRFLPIPRIASKSSTLLNAPYDLRICKIFSAVAGPMPGTCCNSSEVAVLMFTGFNGGFFAAPVDATVKRRKVKKSYETNARTAGECHAMGAL